MRAIAVFDFDGTLITKDSFLEFIIFTKGRFALLLGLIIHAPWIILMKAGILSNGGTKQKLFSYFFKGVPEQQFKSWGESFSEVLERHKNEKMVAAVKRHSDRGDIVYVISASVDYWVKPWCNSIGIQHVIGTVAEVRDGIITGRFLSKNCYGEEKVSRFLEIEQDRQSYYLYAYGDSDGDREMLSFADESYLINLK